MIDVRRASRALSDVERRSLVVALHAGAQGAWDWDELANWDADLLNDWGLDNEYLEQMNRDTAALMDLMETQEAEEPAEAPEPQMDRADELRQKWQTETGQLWRLGEHRLICGDCTDLAVVERVMGREKADIVVTDPPYDLPARAVRQALDLLADRAVLLLTGSQAYTLCADGWEYRMDFVWRHRTPRSFPTDAQPVMYHNPILIIAKEGTPGGSGWRRPRPNYASVVEVEGTEFPHDETGHAKSVDLFVEMMCGFSVRTWVDPFIGSGTTILAARELGRRCYGIERDPAILAVALDRCQRAGLEPIREID